MLGLVNGVHCAREKLRAVDPRVFAQIDYLPPGGTDPFLLGSHKPTTDGGEDVYCFIGFMEEAGAGAVGFGVVDVHMPALAEDRTHTTEYVLMYSVECLTFMFRVHRTLY